MGAAARRAAPATMQLNTHNNTGHSNAIAAENRPPLKSLVMLGKVQSRVVRNLEEGFALEFVHEQNAETLEDAVTAR